jgi:NAD(P)-dependent dehydrogenase (short-subunit alcohol dehydrogenase family)
MGRLSGKVALITGGTTGIGLATAVLFAEQHAKVFVLGRRQSELDAAVTTIGRGAVGIRGDISALADLDRAYAQIEADAGRVDVLVANAGGGELATLGEISEDHFDRTFAINVKGTLFTVQKALPLMAKGGSIILIGSTAGSTGTRGLSVYSASKAAVRSLARSWILDLKGQAVRINVLSPGPTLTPAVARIVLPDQVDAYIEQLRSVIPLERIGQPQEIAAAALFLASDESSFVNGTELFADGGSAQV